MIRWNTLNGFKSYVLHVAHGRGTSGGNSLLIAGTGSGVENFSVCSTVCEKAAGNI